VSAPRQDLTPLLAPRSVAIVGISRPGRFGGWLRENLVRAGFDGEIYGVNPRYDSLYDAPCYASLHDLPERPDCVLVAVPNAGLLDTFEQAAHCGVPAAVVFANAHSDPAPGEVALQTRLVEIARAHDMVVCGPNCMGFVAPGRGLAVSGYETPRDLPAGGVSVIAHSGSVWEALLQNRRGIAFDTIVSSGNEMVTTLADYMQFALRQPTTRVLGVFLETVRDPETFLLALDEAAQRDVPVVMVKTGRTERGARMTLAHSGALAGDDAVYEAIFAHHGVCRADSIDELLDTLELFATGMRPSKPGVSALLDSGGQRALLVDLADVCGVGFAEISKRTESRLAEVLEPGLEATNPLDAWGTGNGADDIYAECLRALDADPATGMTLFAVDVLPIEDGQPGGYPPMVRAVLPDLTKPLAWLVHAASTASATQMAELRDMGIPVLMGTETGLRATRHVLEYAAFQRERAARGEPAPARASADAEPARATIAASNGPLGEHESKALLAAYGLTVTREARAETLDEARRAAGEIGYPVALKTATGDLHKTERGGVRLDIADEAALRRAYAELEAALGAAVLVAEMVPPGVELLLGVVDDAQFGPLLTLGLGGIFVEALNDVRMLPLPTRPESVRAALASLRGAALLAGIRGRAAADVDAVVAAAMGLSRLALDLGDAVSEIDVNPLVALPDRAVVVDALIVPRGDDVAG
jgi:acyl-CoA synthetase (NDP forming)